MKNSMMMIAVIFALGLSAASHAQTEPKTGQDRIRSEYTDPAKKCDGLNGDARTACLKEAQKADAQKADAQKPRKDDMKSAPKAPDAKK